MKTRQMMLFLVFLCLTTAAATLAERSIAPPYEPVDDYLVRVTVIGDERGPLSAYPVYRYEKYLPDSRLRITARQGERYSIRVTNTSRGRIALTISVDGLNIISGQRSYGGSNESMYVLNPGQTGDFAGWRSGMSHVQRFYFTSAGDSYAGRLGQSDQLGLIRVVAYREHRPVVYLPYDSLRRSEAESKSMAESAPGTGYGESSWSPVSETDFNPESYPGQTVEIKYEWSTPRYYEHDHDYERPRRDFAEPPPGR